MYCITVSIEKRPHFINKGDDVFADDSTQPKIGDLVLHWEQYHGERLKICFYTEEVAQTKDTCHVVTQITKHIPNDDEAREERLKRIDWNKTASTDDIESVSDDIKGINVLIDGLACAEHVGTMKDQRHAFNVLSKVAGNIVGDLKIVKEQVDYMQEIIRQ